MTMTTKGLCPNCGVPLPGPYGTPGVSLSRQDNTTLICSACGIREAFGERVDIGPNTRPTDAAFVEWVQETCPRCGSEEVASTGLGDDWRKCMNCTTLFRTEVG